MEERVTKSETKILNMHYKGILYKKRQKAKQIFMFTNNKKEEKTEMRISKDNIVLGPMP